MASNVKNVIPKTVGTEGQDDDYAWAKGQQAVKKSQEYTGATGGTGGLNSSSGGTKTTASGTVATNTNGSYTEPDANGGRTDLKFPTVGSVDSRDKSGSVSSSGSGGGSGSGSGGSSVQAQQSAPAQTAATPNANDAKYAELLGKYDELIGQLASSQESFQKQMDEMASGFNTERNTWAQQLADIYASQSEKEAQWKQDIENMYKKGQDDAYTKAEEERKKALEAGVKQAENTISGQKENISGSYADTLRQLYLQKMQGQKNIGQQLAAQGATGGLAESTLQGLENNYQNALMQSENQRTQTLNDLDRQLKDAQLAASIEEANGAANSAVNRANSYVQALQSLLSGEQTNKAQYASVLESLMNEEDQRNAQYASILQYLTNNERSDASESKQYAYNLASSMLSSGAMPSQELLTAAGISAADAAAIIAAQNAATAAKVSGGSSSGGSKKTTQTAEIPKVSDNAANVAYNAYLNGDRSAGTVQALESYYGMPIATIAAAMGISTPETAAESAAGTAAAQTAGQNTQNNGTTLFSLALEEYNKYPNKSLAKQKAMKVIQDFVDYDGGKTVSTAQKQKLMNYFENI